MVQGGTQRCFGRKKGELDARISESRQGEENVVGGGKVVRRWLGHQSHVDCRGPQEKCWILEGHDEEEEKLRC